MNTLRLITLLNIFLLPMAMAQQPDDPRVYGRWLANSTDTVLGNVKDRLYPHLTSDDRRLVRSIRFRFSPLWNVNAYARNIGGERVVRIDYGYLAVIDQLGLAYIVDNELGYVGCYEDFARRLIEALAENSERISQKRPPSRPMVSVWHLGLDSSSDCYGIDYSEFASSPDAGRYYAGGVEASLTFMILHEIAHHVFAHVGVPTSEMTLARSREHETQADEWAFARSIDIQVNPIGGLPSWIFFSAMDGTDLTQEFRRSHPLEANRFKRMLEVVLERAADEDGYIRTFGEPLPKEIAEDMRKELEHIEYLLGDQSRR